MMDRITKSGTTKRDGVSIRWSIVEQRDGKYRIDLSSKLGWGSRGTFDTEAEALGEKDNAIAKQFS
jgi:hypothetical protein